MEAVGTGDLLDRWALRIELLTASSPSGSRLEGEICQFYKNWHGKTSALQAVVRYSSRRARNFLEKSAYPTDIRAPGIASSGLNRRGIQKISTFLLETPDPRRREGVVDRA
jgi:hypothetical protein